MKPLFSISEENTIQTQFHSVLFDSCSSGPMATSVSDSIAAFKKHAEELQLAAELLNGLIAAELNTFSKLSYHFGNPTKDVTEEQLTELCQAIKPAAFVVTIGQKSILRRIVFEAQTLTINNLKSKSEPASDAAPAKLPLPERESRLTEQKARLTGLAIKGELEPSHQLIDLVNHMVEHEQVMWLAPSRCSKREQELAILPKDRNPVLQLEQKVITLATPELKLEANTSTDMRTIWALQRRGIAFDQTRALDWETHESWVRMMLDAVARDPPPGFARVQLSQSLRADRELWLMLSDECRGAVRVKADNSKPLDEAFRKFMVDPRVTFHLMPLMGPTGKESASGHSEKHQKRSSSSKPEERPNKQAKGKSKGKVPKELIGLTTLSSSGPRCFGFNLPGGCKNKTSGNPPKCHRGVHECCGCGGLHSYQSCPQKKKE